MDLDIVGLDMENAPNTAHQRCQEVTLYVKVKASHPVMYMYVHPRKPSLGYLPIVLKL